MARAMRALAVAVETPYDGGCSAAPDADCYCPAGMHCLHRGSASLRRGYWVQRCLPGVCKPGRTRSMAPAAITRRPDVSAPGLPEKVACASAPGAVLDIVGTGGDGIGSVNISTGATVIAAAAGAKVAKHGNRSGERCGAGWCAPGEESADACGSKIASLPLCRQLAAPGTCARGLMQHCAAITHGTLPAPPTCSVLAVRLR